MSLVEEFKNFFETKKRQYDPTVLQHEGVSILDGAPGRGSGRYPLGSGENPNQHRDPTFLDRYNKMKAKGMSDAEIAAEMGILGPPTGKNRERKPSSDRLRVQVSLAKHERDIEKISKIKELSDKGYNPTEIARMLGYAHESSVRNYLKEDKLAKKQKAMVYADLLKEMVDSYETKDTPGMVDVGKGVERQLGITEGKLKEALYILELQGYPTYPAGIKQGTKASDNQTTVKVLCTPGTEWGKAYDFNNIHSVEEYGKIVQESPGTGEEKIVPAFRYPSSLDSSRIQVVYAEDGGKDRDGMVSIRRGVDDLSLGLSNYSQVRILVDGTHYIKGVATYGEDKNFEKGKDIIVYSNKKKGTPLKTDDGSKQVLKNITDDPDNPFGSAIKAGINTEHGGQSTYIDKNGKEQLSLINKRSDEGDWGEWSKDLPSQFLSKQPLSLAKRQLGIAKDNKSDELKEIMEITNPTVKKQLLLSYADDCDAASADLKAAALPRQKYQVILPLTTTKYNECYAPNFDNGERLALIRFPHSGPAEIPIVTVNNNNKEGKSIITNSAKDAIGINSKVAERLSGADFDGDTVLAIPINDKINVKSRPAYKELENFDNKDEYGHHEKKIINGVTHYYRFGKEFKPMTDTGREMGVAANLITDMFIGGAKDEEIARAIKYSMVVIDAEKHGLDWKQAEKDFKIVDLKKKYQKKDNKKGYGGSSTLISRAKGPTNVPKRQGSPRINPETGELEYKVADDLYKKKVNKKTGEISYEMRTQQVSQMSNVKDARELSTGTPMEELYADYANSMKKLANQARLEYLHTGEIKQNKTAATTYAPEVASLNKKLDIAERNKPRERQARMEAISISKSKESLYRQEGKSWKEYNDDLQKEYQRALTSARAKYKSHREPIVIEEREWEAIQAGAISPTKLKKILDNADMTAVRKLATPRDSYNELSKIQQSRIKRLARLGYTNADIARDLGISTSTVSKYV